MFKAKNKDKDKNSNITLSMKLSPKIEPEIQNFLNNFDFSKFREIITTHHIVFPQIIKRKANEVKSIIRENDTIYFAMKSTTSKSLLQEIVNLNCGLDVSTLNELKLAKELGCTQILAGGPKSSKYLQEAVKYANLISIDSIYELDEIISLNKNCEILIRVNDLEVFRKNISIRRSKFGIRSSQVEDCLKRIKQANSTINVKGIHFHSDGYSPEDRALFFNHIFNLFSIIKSYNHQVSIINLGGSFNEEILDNNLDFEDFLRENMNLIRNDKDSVFLNNNIFNLEFDTNSKTFKGVNNAILLGVKKPLVKELEELYSTICVNNISFKELLEENNISLLIEPGYSLSTNCGISIVSVQGQKDFDKNNKLVVVNGHKFNISASMFSHLTNPLFVSFNSKKSKNSKNSKKSNFEILDLNFNNDLAYVTGSLCREDDFLMNRKIPIPKHLNKQDLMIFINTGSYTMSYENCSPQRFEKPKYFKFENNNLTEEK